MADPNVAIRILKIALGRLGDLNMTQWQRAATLLATLRYRVTVAPQGSLYDYLAAQNVEFFKLKFYNVMHGVDVSIVNRIGSGAYGDVYKALMTMDTHNNKAEIALKIISGGLDQEARVHSKVSAVNLLHVVRYFFSKEGGFEVLQKIGITEKPDAPFVPLGRYDPNKYGIIGMELLKGNNLFDYLMLTEKDISTVLPGIVFQMAYTLAQLDRELKGFIHTDLHAGNVFVCDAPETPECFMYTFGSDTYRVESRGLVPKIVDFGLCRMGQNSGITMGWGHWANHYLDDIQTLIWTLIGPAFSRPYELVAPLIDMGFDILNMNYKDMDNKTRSNNDILRELYHILKLNKEKHSINTVRVY